MGYRRCKCGACMEHLLVEGTNEECVFWCPECGRALCMLQEETAWHEPSCIKQEDELGKK